MLKNTKIKKREKLLCLNCWYPLYQNQLTCPNCSFVHSAGTRTKEQEQEMVRKVAQKIAYKINGPVVIKGGKE